MPKITQIHLIEISPEKFLEACNPVELQEIELLISSPRFQVRMEDPDRAPVVYPDRDLLDSPELLIH